MYSVDSCRAGSSDQRRTSYRVATAVGQQSHTVAESLRVSTESPQLWIARKASATAEDQALLKQRRKEQDPSKAKEAHEHLTHPPLLSLLLYMNQVYISRYHTHTCGKFV